MASSALLLRRAAAAGGGGATALSTAFRPRPRRRRALSSRSSSSSSPPASSFRPRRTPPPSAAGVDLRPRPDAFPSPSSIAKDRPLRGGEGRAPGWVSPHHLDYYDRLDDGTVDHPYLMHGDPHMPVQKLAGGRGRVALDPLGGKAKEMDDYRGVGGARVGKTVAPADLSGLKDVKDHLASQGKDAARELAALGIADAGEEGQEEEDEDDDDELAQEFGSDAAHAIRTHLVSFKKRLDEAARSGDAKTYSPLLEVEENFRTIDRLTSEQGTTQDLALRRRARSEGREFFELGRIPKLVDDGDGGDEFVGPEAEVGKDRGYDPDHVFGKNAKVHFPYGEEWPTPTYHPDFPKGSNAGDNPTDHEEEEWMHELNRLIEEERSKEMELGELDETYKPVNIQKEDMDHYLAEQERSKRYRPGGRDNEWEKEREEKPDEILEMIKNGEDPNREAYGPWAECTIKVDRVQKVERGGTTVRYRALVIGGNGNGAAGFGVAKSHSPNEAVEKACKHCKRNVFYIDRYLNQGLSFDLAGKHNSCKVHLRAVTPDYGLHGHPLICEILKHAGITDASTKSHGNRNPFNVVYATFKALMTHESLEEIAMKRGKKLLNLQRARRLGLH
ncbi:hypothetical protein ACHAWF_015533 [Thalassiosira exigua]